jgi:hypothetical protein
MFASRIRSISFSNSKKSKMSHTLMRYWFSPCRIGKHYSNESHEIRPWAGRPRASQLTSERVSFVTKQLSLSFKCFPLFRTSALLLSLPTTRYYSKDPDKRKRVRKQGQSWNGLEENRPPPSSIADRVWQVRRQPRREHATRSAQQEDSENVFTEESGHVRPANDLASRRRLADARALRW